MHSSKALDDWCSLIADFVSVDRLKQAFEGTKPTLAQTYFDLKFQLVSDLTEFQQKAEADVKELHLQFVHVQEYNAKLRVSLVELNATHNELMAPSLSQKEEIGYLFSRFPEKQPLAYSHFFKIFF